MTGLQEREREKEEENTFVTRRTFELLRLDAKRLVLKRRGGGAVVIALG